MEKHKVRTNIYLTPMEYEVLRRVSHRTGSSVAELIRRAVDVVYSADFEREAASMNYKASRIERAVRALLTVETAETQQTRTAQIVAEQAAEDIAAGKNILRNSRNDEKAREKAR
jgi:hypothetical protein